MSLHEMFKIADIHATRIETAIKHTHQLFPINPEAIKNIEENDLAWVEFLVSRFAKLRDFLGGKIINEFLRLTGDLVENSTMLDKINQLERLEIIEDAELWKEMRDVRNHISHEYPDNPELMAKYLNRIFDLAPKLLAFYYEIKKRS